MQDFISEHELNRVLTKKKVRLKNEKCEANGKKKPLTNSHKTKYQSRRGGGIFRAGDYVGFVVDLYVGRDRGTQAKL